MMDHAIKFMIIMKEKNYSLVGVSVEVETLTKPFTN